MKLISLTFFLSFLLSCASTKPSKEPVKLGSFSYEVSGDKAVAKERQENLIYEMAKMCPDQKIRLLSEHFEESLNTMSVWFECRPIDSYTY